MVLNIWGGENKMGQDKEIKVFFPLVGLKQSIVITECLFIHSFTQELSTCKNHHIRCYIW